METLRFQVVGEAFKKKPLDVKAPAERPAKYFGKKVFNREKMYTGEHIGHGAYRRPHARCVLERFGLPKDYSPELLIRTVGVVIQTTYYQIVKQINLGVFPQVDLLIYLI